jgi:site-specific DNA-methyltransferase (cytosine-N4-specific)
VESVEVLPDRPGACVLHHGAAEGALPTLESGSIHSVVTSPPYWKKRRYSPTGDPDELGQEATPEAFVAHLVAILRPLKRVLRRDGVLLLLIGDGHYNVYGGGSKTMTSGNARHVRAMGRSTPPRHPRLQRKSLIRVPWKLADALEEDGWLIRNAMPWHKTNPLPETLTDRTTTDCEVVLHCTRGPDYFWNADHPLVAEPAPWDRRGAQTTPKALTNGPERASGAWLKERSREEIHGVLARPTKNRRSVLTGPVSTYKGQHSAVMPEWLAELLVAASTPPGGVCLYPFAGAATTGVAVLRLGEGRTFVGIEREAESVEEATGRLRAEAQRLEAVRARPGVPLAPLPTTPGGWQLVLADPPGPFRARAETGYNRSASRHYPTMPVAAIMALPVPAVAARDSLLALWVTVPRLQDGFAVLGAWGYAYATAFTWVKTVAQGGSPPGVWRGTGLHLRGNAEVLLIGRRGKGLRLVNGPGDSLLVAPRREHSRKPGESYRRLEQLYGDVRRLELFGREARPGWTVWGDEVGRFPHQLPLDVHGGEAAG